MKARILANLVLSVHFTFVIFSVLGDFLVLWKRWIAWFQVPSVLWSSFVNLFSHVCPLTPIENRFRRLAGQASYEGGFYQALRRPFGLSGRDAQKDGADSGLFGSHLERVRLRVCGSAANR
jgi:hypothetical protein